ncbi:MAG: tRNA (adenosine(37)-N6)-dimethylallyltransferase MiaA [Archangium sp.]|nr:tRNA (adenosine(37)-N6)-dimethylallyltransferase MiaA [Archangium sp.]
MPPSPRGGEGKPLLVIAGPTASGKTALAIEIAGRLNAEIISADSQQVYRHFDIGTAKPSAAELAAIPHHLISIADPLEDFSAARFGKLADAAIADIQSRGKRVVVVGGTGLYLRVLLHGVMPGPSRDEALRAELEAFADREGNEALHARLAKVDPVTAAKHPVQDRLRVIRALEIHQLTGKPASEHRDEHAFAADRYEYRLFVLNPPREKVYEAINLRTRKMYEAGLLDETRALVAKGYREAAPMRAVGYLQALQVLDGTLTKHKALEDTAQATRHYAKRQWTWFKKEKGAVLAAPENALEQILSGA